MEKRSIDAYDVRASFKSLVLSIVIGSLIGFFNVRVIASVRIVLGSLLLKVLMGGIP